MSELQIIFDESMENPPLDGYKIVETEIEFLQSDGEKPLWVRGQVCNFARGVYQARKVKFQELDSPRLRLRSLIGDVADRINSALLNLSSKILEREKPQDLAELLFYLTGDDFWTSPASITHAARFLTIDFDNELIDLAESQKQIWLAENRKSKLKQIYEVSFSEREEFLHYWLFDERMRRDLGEFPLSLSEKRAESLYDEIGRQLRASEGAIISEFPKRTPNKETYAKAAVGYFSQHTTRLSVSLLAEISPLLSSTERSKLEKLLPLAELAPLEVTADFQTALNWAAEKYLPFCADRAEHLNSAETDDLAASFSEWILKNYPKLTNFDRDTSPINLRTFYTVKKLLEQGYWVLWAVVDGLNYINHQELLRILGEKSANLRVAENSPVFAVLPTITEKAKYGLTSGNFPSENIKRDFDPKRNFFAKFPGGIYAGNSEEDKLLDGLKREKPTVCYWNYTEIDYCFHQRKTVNFIENKINSLLYGLAENINQLVSMARDINRVAVMICSDHGQMTTQCRKLDFDLDGRNAHGRTALDKPETIFAANSDFIKADNGETVYLNPTSFRLSEPTTIALGSTYFVDLKASEKHGAIGVHGGLFPEEAVVGLAVLMREPKHKKLSVTVMGAGEAGRNGNVVLSIDNPNQATVGRLLLTINNLKTGGQDVLFSAKIGAQDKADFEIEIEKFPEPTLGEEFQISGVLRYEFDDGAPQECEVTGKLICKSLYNPKNPSLNRFKK